MLAAQWLWDRIQEGGSAVRVTDKFIKTVFGKPRVPTAYGGMLAWLASYEPLTRRRMIQTAPEWVMEGGDPRSLALEDRIAAFRRHFELGPHRFSGEFMFDVSELRRFSRSELEDEIVARLAMPPDGDLFDHLMQITEAGRYRSAAPALIAILKDFSRSAGDRMFAIRALIACGTTDHLREVAKHFIATGGPTISTAEAFAVGRHDRFILDLTMASYPEAIGAEDALQLFSQLQGKVYTYEAKSVAIWLTDVVSASDLERWVIGLDALCIDARKPYKPFGYDSPSYTRRATVLLRGFLDIVARYILEASKFELPRDLLIYDRARHATRLSGSFSISRRGSPITPAIFARTEFRRALYERLAAIEKRKQTAFVYFEHLGWSALNEEAYAQDILWLTGQYRASSGDIRRDYAETIIAISYRLQPLRRAKCRMSLFAAAIGQSHPDWWLIKQVTIDPLVAPLRRYRAQRRLRYRDPDEGIKAASRRALERIRHQFEIWRSLSALRQGSAENLLVRLVLNDGHEVPSEADLRKRLGDRLAEAAIEGAIAFARRYRPIDRGRGVFNVDILAQAGYGYAWNTDRSMPGIDPTEALRAALLFALEWTDWATGLALDHRQSWSTLAVPILQHEIASATPNEFGNYVRNLSTIAHLEEAVRAPIARPLFEAIRSARFIDGIDLDRLMRILSSDPAIESDVLKFAARLSREAWYEGAPKRALNWLPYWASDDEVGLRTLLSWAEVDPTIIPDAMGIYVRLFGENSKTPRPSLEIRLRFAKLAYATIRPADDPPPKEGAHDVTKRDDLQQLRGSVGELLSSDFDELEREALEEFLNQFIEPFSHEWAERWRNRYGQAAIKPSPWPSSTIVEAGRELATSPATGGELFDRVSELLSDLESELASNEFDRRGLFNTGILESDFRAWLGHALDSRRRPWFSIVQEAETAQANRTDLRLELRGKGDAVVVVEIKLFHGWSYDDLLSKFRTQLVDQYLLSPRVRHGIYLVVDLGGSAKGSLADGSKPSSNEIIETLNAAASTMAAEGGPIAKAQVFKIAPTKRNVRRDVRSPRKSV